MSYQDLSDALRAWLDDRSPRKALDRYEARRRKGEPEPRVDITFSDARSGQALSAGGDAFAQLLRDGAK
jgi:hypothetical protein